MQFQHNDNGQKGEFFRLNDAGERVAEISYIWQGEHQIIADHTWVDDSLRGQGAARQLLDVLVEFARKRQLKIVPTCSYVDVMFKREPELQDVVATV